MSACNFIQNVKISMTQLKKERRRLAGQGHQTSKLKYAYKYYTNS